MTLRQPMPFGLARDGALSEASGTASMNATRASADGEADQQPLAINLAASS